MYLIKVSVRLNLGGSLDDEDAVTTVVGNDSVGIDSVFCGFSSGTCGNDISDEGTFLKINSISSLTPICIVRPTHSRGSNNRSGCSGSS